MSWKLGIRQRPWANHMPAALRRQPQIGVGAGGAPTIAIVSSADYFSGRGARPDCLVALVNMVGGAFPSSASLSLGGLIQARITLIAMLCRSHVKTIIITSLIPPRNPSDTTKNTKIGNEPQSTIR